jgi:hypothetical protein
MGRLTITVHPHVSGPLFDGHADEIIRRAEDEAAKELAETGRDWVKLAAEAMDRSGRGGSGAASAGVSLEGSGGSYRVYGGIREGEYSWPWLEGTSERNRTTKFRGYHTFRKTRTRMDTVAADVLERHIAAVMPEIGGE